ncbi:hypothetical protein M569_06036 [Genlisea aurea]|uniref:Uncharacterized protein n=1 Tax=Genlisea aurea TaxID=192259 RepID=S8E8E6_9LAMI|nr:hypothetical protein M569_06036 [Genlisea aurea]
MDDLFVDGSGIEVETAVEVDGDGDDVLPVVGDDDELESLYDRNVKYEADGRIHEESDVGNDSSDCDLSDGKSENEGEDVASRSRKSENEGEDVGNLKSIPLLCPKIPK